MTIIPIPKNITEFEGNYTLHYFGKILVDFKSGEAARMAARLLQNAITDYLGFEYTLSRGDCEAEIKIVENEDYPTEKYNLCISKEGILIEGGRRGVLYGVRTLTQLFMTEGAVLPLLIMDDYPAFKERAFYYDVTRGRIPTLSYLKKLADTLSFYKINQLQLYIEHCFMFEGHSEIWRDDTPLTAEEILELDDYCEKIGVELVPSLSTFGHMYKILNSKSFGHMCEIDNTSFQEFGLIDRMRHHTLNVTLDESFEFVCSILNEYIPLFKSERFNICADETFDLGKGKSKELCDKLGLPRLYMDFVKKIISRVAAHGKTPMVWGDIMLKFPEFVKELPPNTICLDWHYNADVKEDSVKTYANLLDSVYVCPGVSGWNQLVNKKDAYINIKKMCAYGSKYGVRGVLNTDWGDFGHINHPDHSLIGMIYGACGSWSGEMEEQEVLDAKISIIAYGNSNGKVVGFINDLSECQYFGWYDLVIYKEKIHDPQKYEKDLADRLFSKKKDITKYNKMAEDIIGKIKAELSNTQINNRKMLYSYLLAAEGIKLFNTIGKIFIQKKEPEVSCWKLAEQLEYWLHDYQKLWRSVSKESELKRITEGIIFYADLLRGCENNED